MDILRKKQYSAAFVEEDFTRKNERPNFFRLKESAYENLGFPDDMLYERRSELRKECSKFIRFSYLIDFLAMDALKNIYTFSVNDLIMDFNTLVQNEDSNIIKQKGQQKAIKGKEPQFNVDVDFMHDIEIPENEIEKITIPEFILPPIGESKIPEFNILHHVHLRERKKKSIENNDEEEEDEEKEELFDEEEELEEDLEEEEEENEMLNYKKTYIREIVPQISKIWLYMRPNKKAFFGDIMSCIVEGMNCIRCFERWSRHDEMTTYVSVLEEWDDMVGDTWEVPDSNFLNPQDWLENSPSQKYSPIVSALLGKAFDRAENFLQEFNSFLMIFWENSRMDMDIFKDDRLSFPGETLKNTLSLLKYQKEFIEAQMPLIADLGMLRFNCTKIKEKVLPSPDSLITKLKGFFIELLRVRNKNLKDWFSNSSYSLKTSFGTIDEFVKQQISLKAIETELSKMKYRFDVLGYQYYIIKDNEFDVKKEDDLSYRDTLQSLNTLNSSIQHVR